MMRRSRRVSRLLACMALALGCGHQTPESSQQEATSGSGSGGSPSSTTSFAGGGSGASTNGGGGPISGACVIRQVEVPPEWSCSAEQIAAARGAISEPTEPDSAGPELEQVTCDELAEPARARLKQQLKHKLDVERGAALRRCLPTTRIAYTDSAGNPVTWCGTIWSSGGASSSAPFPGPPDTTDQNDGATETSSTNTQVADVDEADYVKNDNNTLFVLTHDSLRVIDAWPAEQTREVARVAISGSPRRMFLSEQRLVVYSNVQTGSAQQNPSSQGCTYGYDCRFQSEGGHTLITVFDVSVPSQPKELARYETSGGFVSARRVGSSVYTVVHDASSAHTVPGVAFGLDKTDPKAVDESYAKLIANNERAVDEISPADFLPWLRKLSATGAELGRISECNSALTTAAAGGNNFISLVAFDLTTLSNPTRTLIASAPGFVYASADALYLAVDGANGKDQIPRYQVSTEERSSLHKFALDKTDVRYVGTATVDGHVLNQFSMDEQDGVLRVATSLGWVPAPNVSSSVTTFTEAMGKFVKVGELKRLAPSEDIRSVRFDGDRGYIVTFKKTDPLFVIDLADPHAPTVLGELKIPGFSTYMHRIDENHLLSVGFDADERGSFAYFDGILVQLFDVSDPTAPKLEHKAVIGTRGSGSEALMNHLAFNYFASRKLLAMPATVCEGGGDGVSGDELSFTGLIVFDISTTDGIHERGRLPFSVNQREGGGNCGQWWSDSTSLVKRSVFFDDYAYALSDGVLNVAQVDDLSKLVASVPLTP